MKKASFRFQNPSKFFLLIYIALGEMEGGYDAHRGSLWTTPVCPPTGTALAVGPAAQQGGRRKAAPFHSFSAPQPDSLDPGRGPSILFTGWGQGVHLRRHSGCHVTSGEGDESWTRWLGELQISWWPCAPTPSRDLRGVSRGSQDRIRHGECSAPAVRVCLLTCPEARQWLCPLPSLPSLVVLEGPSWVPSF